MVAPFVQMAAEARRRCPQRLPTEAAVGSVTNSASAPPSAVGAAPPGDTPLLSYHEAVSALSAIPADCSAEARRRVALGLQFGLGDAGQALWLEWAACRTYPDPEADAREWAQAVGHSAVFVVRLLQHAHSASLSYASAAAAVLARAAIDKARRGSDGKPK